MIFHAMDTDMYYEIHGESGRPLLLLHGWGGCVDSFLPLTRDFKKMRRVFVVDFPGHGQSGEPAVPWSVTEYAQYISLFMTEMGIAGADIIAHSFGGRVSILLAATRPELVGKLILTGAAGVKPQKTTSKSLKSRVYRLLKGFINSGMANKLFSEQRIALWREALVQKFGSPDYRVLTPYMRQTFNRVIGQDLTDYLKDIKSSTLLIWGETDTETPLWMGKIMEEKIPDAGLVTLPGCGHFAYLDRYGDFKRIADHFLG